MGRETLGHRLSSGARRRLYSSEIATSRPPISFRPNVTRARQRPNHWKRVFVLTLLSILLWQSVTYSLPEGMLPGALFAVGLTLTIVVAAIASPSLVFRGFLLTLSIPLLLNIIPFFASLDSRPRTGWSARGDFEGSPLETVEAFGPPVVALLLLTALGFIFVRLNFLPLLPPGVSRQQLIREPPVHVYSNHVLLIPIFVMLSYVVFMWMDGYGIGTPGYQPQYLAFRLVGLSYYGMLIMPLVVSILVAKHQPGLTSRLLILGLPLVAGLTTSSRTFVLAWSLPLAVILVRRFSPLFLTCAAATVALGFHATFIVRGFRYATVIPGPQGLSSMPGVNERFLAVVMQLGDTPTRVLSALQRVAGPQEAVLASQFVKSSDESMLERVLGFFVTSAGPEYSHAAWHISWAGFIPPEDFFAGPGTVGQLILILHHGWLPLVAVMTAVAVFLTLVERLMNLCAPLLRGVMSIDVFRIAAGGLAAIVLTTWSIYSPFIFSSVGFAMAGLLIMNWLRSSSYVLSQRRRLSAQVMG